jgi:hypothetical protein
MKKEDSWHLSKSVPITFIVAIGLQTAALVWYVSTLQSQAVTLGRMDENIKAIREMMERSRREQ